MAASVSGNELVRSSGENSVRSASSNDGVSGNHEGSNGEVQAAGTNDQGQQQPPPQQQFSLFQMLRGIVMNALIIYFITSYFRKSPSQPAGNEIQKLPSSNLFSNGTVFDMLVYLSESEKFTQFDDLKSLVWHKEKLVYGGWYDGPEGDGTFANEVHIPASENVQNNGSLYIHVYLVKHGKSPNPKDKGKYSKRYTVHKFKMLNKYRKKRYQKTYNLLTGTTAETPANVEKAEKLIEEIVSYWHSNLTINIVDDHTPWTKGSVPPPLDESDNVEICPPFYHIIVDVVLLAPVIEFEESSGNYYPILYLNDYWNLARDYQPVNQSTKVLNLTLTYQPLSLFRWQLYTAQSMRSRWTSSLLGEGMDDSDEDQDTLKEAFLETSPYLLALTIAVSILHSIFEFLAFKNDIQFWNNRTSLEGLSVRSVFFNVFQSLIVLLYVLDNETNTIVRVSVFVGLAIEIWKIHKVVNIEVVRDNKLFGVLPRIRFSEKGSYAESPTKKYDMLAFRYLSWMLYPLLIGYSIYSLLYLEHKGWYSWVLSMLYGFLLTFGFIMMTPQLFINYKLKSVAHLPWRMMTYKALNTFIDDIFAFVIKMPTMYRLGCFRDDIVFLVYLYQRYIYRVDPKRVNEYGISGEMAMASANGKKALVDSGKTGSGGNARSSEPQTKKTN